MKKAFPLLLLAILTMAATSCEEEIPPVLEVSPRSITMDRAGGEYTFTVQSNKAWKVSSSATWCKLSLSSGDGSAEPVTIKVSAEPNPEYDTRSCLITVRSGDLSAQIDVSQGEKPGLSLTQREYTLTSAEQSLLINFTTNTSYSVIIPDNCKSWIKLMETKALKAMSITLMISRNDTYDSREGSVTIRGEEGDEAALSITQSQADAILVSEHHYDLSFDEQTLELKYSTNMNQDDYEIVISEEAREWIVQTEASTKALRDETVSFLIKENTSCDDTREGMITFRSKDGEISENVTVSQGEKPGLSLTQREYTLTSAEQSLLVQFSTNIPYSVIIPDDCKSWIKLMETKAMDTRSITLMISRNDTYDRREGTVVIRGETGMEAPMTIIQSQEDAILLSEHHYDFSYEEQVLELKYSTNLDPDDFEIVISEEARQWIEHTEIPTRALREETVYFLIKENPSDEKTREGMITFRNKNGEVSENVTVTQDVIKDIFKTPLSRMLIPGDNFAFTLPLTTDMGFEYYVDAGDDWLTLLDTRSVTDYKIQFAAKANLTESSRDGVIRFQSSDGMHSDAVNVRQLPLGKGIINIEFEGKRTPETEFEEVVSWQYHWDDGTFAPTDENSIKNFDDIGPHSYRLMVEMSSGSIEFDAAGIKVLDLRQL